MNTTDRQTQHFDRQARQLHQAALHALDPATLARLRAARQAGAQGRHSRLGRRGWVLATACSALLAVGLGVHLNRLGTAPNPATTSVLVATVDGDEVLEQNPDLYVWLGSQNALAMEQTR
ncbi:MAG TPA: hypothetical protein VM687_18545 [Stenotrophomonas sp.]|nr:hypothetical protein [Stenotrophomonas sp.]